MTQQPETPNIDVHLTRLFTRDIVEIGGQIIRRLNIQDAELLEYRLTQLAVAAQELRVVSSGEERD